MATELLMSEDFEQQTFNDDLLGNRGDLERARVKYRTIIHVLDHPELRKLFKEYDTPANSARRRSRRLGIAAILLGTVAILSASIEAIPPAQSGPSIGTETWRFPIALLASVLGLVSVLVGSIGLLSGGAKRQWLHRRLMTERLRQFHFQTFIVRLPEIVASLQSDRAKAEYTLTRHKWLDEFRADFESKLAATFTNIIENEKSDYWIHRPPKFLLRLAEHPELESLFEAYRELRIKHQISYANYKLRNDHRILSNAARKQATVLEAIGLVGIALLLFIHITLAVGVIGMTFGWISPSVTELIPLLDTIVIWIAVGALSARALAARGRTDFDTLLRRQ